MGVGQRIQLTRTSKSMARRDVVESVRALGYNLSLSELASYQRWDVSHVPCVPQLATTLGVFEMWLMTGDPGHQRLQGVSASELDIVLLEHWQALDLNAKRILVRMAAALGRAGEPH